MTTQPESSLAAAGVGSPVRALVFEDSVYTCGDGELATDRAFLFYVSQLADHGVALTLMGRVGPLSARSYYRLPPAVGFVGLPHYPSLVHPAALPGIARSLRRSWLALGRADVAWLMGPHPLSCMLAGLARIRGVPVVLGVRQDLPRYARERHPGRRWAHRAADLLEAFWRRVAQRCAVVAVGPELSRHYASAARLLPLDICLVPSADVGSAVPQRSYDGELRLLSVGRLEQEKNPLLLAEVLALLRADDPRWRLVVCGEGSLEGELRTRLAALGVEEHAEMLGYVPVDQGLLELYRTSHVFLHVSWTEGLPQVLFEAWAAGLPVVATAVGGVPEAVGDAALLVPPGEAGGAASAVRSLVADKPLRSRLVGAGADRLVGNGMEEGVGRLAGFLREVAATGRR